MANIRKRGSKWQVQVRRAGQPHITKTFNKKSDAHVWARDMDAKGDRGEIGRVGDKDLTFGCLLKKYRAEVVANKLAVSQEGYIVDRLLRHSLSKTKLMGISPEPFAKYRDERVKLVSGSTVRREFGVIQHAFNTAIQEWGWVIPCNPITQIKKPRANEARDRRLCPQEEGLLIRETANCKNDWLKPAILFALETAMRRGELLAVRWQDIDWQASTVFLPQTKNGYARTVPVTPKARDILQGIDPTRSERVFDTTANAFKLSWQRLVKRTGIQDLHFHDLRHEAISRFFEMGLSVPEVALISGHRDYRMLARYTHMRPENIAAKLGKSEDFRGLRPKDDRSEKQR